MKSDKHKRKHRMFIRALKELDAISEQQQRAPFRKLNKPYQQGWWLIAVLREDFARSKEGPIVQSILNKLCSTPITRSSKVVGEIRRKMGTYGYTHWWWSQLRPGVEDITTKEYNLLSPRQRKYFHYAPMLERYGKQYHFVLPHYLLRVKVEQRMITHVRDIDPALESREAELRNILEAYWRISGNGESWNHYFENRSERRRVKVELSKYSQHGEAAA